MKLSFKCFALLLGSVVIASSSAQSAQWESSEDRSCTYRGYPKKGSSDDDDSYDDYDDTYHSDDGSSCQCPEPPPHEDFTWEGERPSNRTLLNAEEIPKFVTDLPIPTVLHDDQAKEYRRDDGGIPYFIVALRQFYQQILPDVHHAKFPKTKVWGFGDPDRPETFSNPSNSLEVTVDQQVEVVWVNDLVNDPDKCRKEGHPESCNHLVHILEDRNGIPLVDQTLHWANPPQTCKDGSVRPDCVGDNADPYTGPIPHVIHNHGAHVQPDSDGYPEAWYLPPANTIPEDFAKVGSFFSSKDDPFKDSVLQCNPDDHSYAVYRYRNDQSSANLWFHDHTLGVTSANAYAASAGSYIIREEDDGETYLAEEDCNGEEQKLPGPPARFGEDTNDPKIRKNIREIPLILRDMSFYDDGSLWFPAVAMWFYTKIVGRSPQPNVPCVSGELYGDNEGLAGDDVPYLPNDNSDIHPIANLIRTFSTIAVNGKTWPRLEVAYERYRFRIVQASDSRTFNLSLKINYDPYHPRRPYKELPFWVIGSDQGLQPHVGKAMSCTQEKVDACESKKEKAEALFGGGPGKGKKEERAYEEARIQEGVGHQNFNGCEFGSEGLVVGPGERYDVIVDFSVLERGETVTLVNLGYEGAHQGGLGLPPLNGFFDEDGLGVNLKTTGLVMKFMPYVELNKEDGDDSTPPEDLILEELEDIGQTTNTRIVGSVVPRSDDLVCGVFYGSFGPNGGTGVGLGTPPGNCTWIEQDCDGTNGFFALSLLLATNGNLGSAATPRKWGEPITENPELNSVEEWEFYNPTAVAHPIHIHLVEFEVLYRYAIDNNECQVDPENCKVGPMLAARPWEKRKDMVFVNDGFMARMKMKFDLPGRYVWHCHLLSHEDNEMMLPMCVGDPVDDCDEPPPSTYTDHFLWESLEWSTRGFSEPSAELDIQAFADGVKEFSEDWGDLGITGILFDAEGDEIFSVTEGTNYCAGPFDVYGLFTSPFQCPAEKFKSGWTEDTKMVAFSNSKHVSAAVFMAAVVETGLGHLDEPIGLSLPQYFGNTTDKRKFDITPRQCFTHTSGIPFEFRNVLVGSQDPFLYDQCFARLYMDVPGFDFPIPQPSLEHCIQFLASDELELIATPGEQWEFTDLAYEIIAALVLEKTKKTFEEAFQKYIAMPLGLEKTSYICPDVSSTAEHQHPAFSMCTTASEFSKFTQMMTREGLNDDGEVILRKDSVYNILTGQTKRANLLSPATDFLVSSPQFRVASSRCRTATREDFGISRYGYGLGVFQNAGTKNQILQHGGFLGSKWVIAKHQYSFYLGLQLPLLAADDYVYRLNDKFDRANKYTVVPPGNTDGRVEVPICSDTWVEDPPRDEEISVPPPYVNLTRQR